ncbi:MAG: fasciclin domain-containing protein [Cyanobacteria bacterium J06633_2]
MRILHATTRTIGLASVVIMGSLLMATTATAESLSTLESESSSEVKSSEQRATIAAIASSNESFEILTAALEAAELVDLLNGSDAFTVFAPTDAAFAALPEGTVDALLQPENRDQLVQILTYHVVPGKVMSTDLSNGAVASAEGRPFEVMIGENGVSINQATVIQANVEASNGVIHVIDQVLLPPEE